MMVSAKKGLIGWLVPRKIQRENEHERVFHCFILGGRCRQRFKHLWSRASGPGIAHDFFSIVELRRGVQENQMGDGIWIKKGLLQGNEATVGVAQYHHFPQTEKLPQALSISSQLGMAQRLYRWSTRATIVAMVIIDQAQDITDDVQAPQVGMVKAEPTMHHQARQSRPTHGVKELRLMYLYSWHEPPPSLHEISSDTADDQHNQ